MVKSRFVTSFDGTRIAYRVYGSGERTVILSNGIGCNQVFFKYLVPELEGAYRVIVWDYRGHVDSESPADRRHLTIDSCMQDLLAVMADAGVDKAVLGGFSMGVQIALEFYGRWPERVLGLIALCGTYEHPLKSFYHMGPLFQAIFPALRALASSPRTRRTAERLWRFSLKGPWAFAAAKHLVFNKDRVHRPDFEEYRPHITNIDIETFFRLGEHLGQHSAVSVLPRVAVPTLIVAGDRDNFTPLAVNVEMRRRIPRAEWHLVSGGSHGALIEYPLEVNAVVRDFLRRHFAA